MKDMIDLANDKVSDFGVEEWTLLKASIMLVGVIIGCTFSDTCKKIRPLLLITWFCVFSYLMIKMFVLPAQEDYL